MSGEYHNPDMAIIDDPALRKLAPDPLLQIPAYVFETAAQVASMPAVTSRKPWFRRAVESAFMNGHQAGRERAARNAPAAYAAVVRGAGAGIADGLRRSGRSLTGDQIVQLMNELADKIERGEYLRD